MNSFFKSHFNYCLLIWLCHSCENKNIEWFHERCLRIVYNNKRSVFKELLGKDDSVSMHMQNLHVLATEKYTSSQ